jgi:hypothetical protein
LTDSEENYIESQKYLCAQYNVDFEKVKELNSRIAPLAKEISKTRSAVVRIQKANADMKRNTEYWLEIWNLITSPKATLAPKQKSLLELYLYLELTEGLLSEIVQVISFMLVESGHDIYNPERMNFAKSYDDLYMIPLFVKQQFLEEHGFNFVSSAINRDLRNVIAHLRFVVNDDGSIIDTRTGKPVKNIIQANDELGCVCALTLQAINGSLANNLQGASSPHR